MKHDIEAAFAASELADIFDKNQKKMLKIFKRPGKWTITAGVSPDKNWPFPDGMISISNGKKADVQIAIEYKRPNEGVHGVLTALGQAFAYISKGYQGTAIVIPDKYPACGDPAAQIIKFINSANSKAPIGVYTYKSALIAPGSVSFKGNLKEEKTLTFHSDVVKKLAGSSKDSTIWVHFREGSSEYDDIYKYCYTAKQLDESKPETFSEFLLPTELKNALKRKGIVEPYAYLSNSVSISTAKNRIWRAYWFKYMAHYGVLQIYDKEGNTYHVHDENSKIKTPSGRYRTFFTQNKKELVKQLNEGTISEDEAWEQFAEKVNSRAHSYRIDIEAFAYGIGFMNSEFKLTELGFRYVNSCISGDPFEDLPKKIFAAACLNNGNMNVFLQFLHSVTEDAFSTNNLKWTLEVKDSKGNVIGYKFDDNKYCSDVEKEFIKLHIIKKASGRGGKKRPALKAEICLLKMLEITDGQYRVGAGLPIDWGKVQVINDYYNTNKLNELDTCNY
ncbi:MAG: hypothetical protein HDR08_02325 [Lachnospiraceae bacterium]|nr:hypothetical protein [Lachnospiraceae bacterium]